MHRKIINPRACEAWVDGIVRAHDHYLNACVICLVTLPPPNARHGCKILFFYASVIRQRCHSSVKKTNRIDLF